MNADDRDVGSTTGHRGKQILSGGLPPEIVDSCCLASLQRTQLAVYLVLCRHARVGTGEAYPSVKTIALKCGRCKRTIQEALKQLVGRRLITVKRIGGGRGRPTVYRIETDPNPIKGAIKAAPLPTAEKAKYGDKRVKSNRQKGADSVAPEHLEHDEHSTTGSDTDGESDQKQDSQDEYREKTTYHALRNAGVFHEVAARLAKCEFLTPGVVQEIAKRVQDRGGGVGALVSAIDNPTATEIEQWQKASEFDGRVDRAMAFREQLVNDHGSRVVAAWINVEFERRNQYLAVDRFMGDVHVLAQRDRSLFLVAMRQIRRESKSSDQATVESACD